jgi:signal transduction histidine kinase
MWRILENLLSNVIKYAMHNSRIYVDIFKMDGYGVLVMKNISATPIDFDETRLTERFVRGDASRTTEGSGLGLSITKAIFQQHSFRFGVQSTVGKGTTFWFVMSDLPYVDDFEGK